MPARGVYLDECVDVALADALRQRGFVAVTTRQAGMLGARDDEQLAHATASGLMMLSHNQGHFRRLHRQFRQHGRAHEGIVLLPHTTPVALLILRVTMMLDWIATLDEYRNRLFTWGTLQDLLDRGYRVPGYTEEDIRSTTGR